MSCCQVIFYFDFVTQNSSIFCNLNFLYYSFYVPFLVLRFCNKTLSPSSNISFFPTVLSFALTLYSLSSPLHCICFLQSTALFQLFGRFPLVPLTINLVIADTFSSSTLLLMAQIYSDSCNWVRC